MSKVDVKSRANRPTTNDIPLNEFLRALYVDGVVDQAAVDAVAADVAVLETDLSTLASTVADHGTDIAALQSDVSTLQTNLTALEARVTALEGKFTAGLNGGWVLNVGGTDYTFTFTDGLLTNVEPVI